MKAKAADVVHIATGEDLRGRTTLSGEILDYTGRELRIKLPNGGEKVIPGERVVRVETERTTQERAADDAFQRHQFADAATLYDQARKSDSRVWSRRRIVAQRIWSLRSDGQDTQACEAFTVLVKSDPDTQFFDCIPLAWLPTVPDLELEQKARRWLEQDASPAEALLGASRLLNSSRGAAAANRLRQLGESEDPRIALLAKAQLWRGQLATAGDQQLAEWRGLIARLPEPLRAGPTFLLGRALAQQKQFEPAALELLRIPILYPRERALAARSLLEAARALHKIGQASEAQRLSREVIDAHPGDECAAEAQEFLKSLSAAPPR